MTHKTSTALRLATLIVALVATGAALADPNLVVNGDFETPDATAFSCFTGTSVGGWTSSGLPGNHGSCYTDSHAWGGVYWPYAHTGQQLMYLNDFGDAGTAVSQAINVTAGTSYHLSVAMAGLEGRTTALLLGVEVAGMATSYAGTAGGSWTVNGTDFTALSTGPTTLKFTATTGSVMIDSVSVVALPPVPEPGSWALLLSGLVAVGSVVRRRAD